MFFSKLKNIHLLSLLGTGSVSVISFVFTAIFFRTFSTHDIGVWFFFQTTISFLDTFRQGFLTTAFIRFYAGSSPATQRETIGSTWFIAILITLLFSVLSIPFFVFEAFVSDDSFAFFFKFCAIYLIVTLPIVISNCVLGGKMEFGKLLYIRVFQSLLLLISAIGLSVFELNTLDNLMTANLFGLGLTSAIVLAKGWSSVELISHRSKKSVLEIFHFGKFTVGTSVSTSLFGITNTYLINFFIGPSAIAIYNLGYKLMEIVEIPLRSFVATALPVLSSAFNRGEQEELIWKLQKYIGVITIALTPFLAITFIFSETVIGLIGGGVYKDTVEGIMAATIFKIASVYALIYPMDRFLAITLDVIHRPKINFIKILVMLFVNFLTVGLGIFFFESIYGVAVATAFPIITGIIISYWAIRRHYYKLSFFNSFRIGYHSIVALVTRNLKMMKLIWSFK